MEKQSNLVPLLLLFGGSVTAFAMAVSIVDTFFTGINPTADQFLWFAISSVVAVIGLNEMRSTDAHNATYYGD